MKLRYYIIPIFLILFFTFPKILFAQTTSENGCCVVDIPVKTSGIFFKTFTNGEPENPTCIKKATAEDCRKQQTTCGTLHCTSFKSSAMVSNCSTQCNSVQQAQISLNSAWCCTNLGIYDEYFRWKEKIKGKIQCDSILAGTNCSNVGGVLEKQSCHSIYYCTQSEQLLKETNLREDAIKKEYEKLKARIAKDRVMPHLNTELPGLKLSEPEIIEFTDKQQQQNGGQLGYIAIPWLGEFISWVYKYALGAAGVIATAMIMVAGFLWITSGGNPNTISQAKKYITSAVFGLILVMCAYLILNFLNPDLVTMKPLFIEIPKSGLNLDYPQCEIDPSQTKVQTHSIDGSTYCANFKDTTKYVDFREELGKGAFKHNGMDRLVIGASLPYITKTGFEGLKQAVKQLTGTEQLRIASTFRAMETQVRLCKCWEMYKESGRTNCPSGAPCYNNCNFAPAPRCTGGHGFGTSIDLRLIGKGDGQKTDWSCSGSGTVQAYNCRSNLQASEREKSKVNCESEQGKAPTGYVNCQERLYKIMQAGSFTGITNEWWHFNTK